MTACQDPGPLDDLRDTVKAYGRHVLVLTGTRGWPGHVEESEGLVGEMARDVIALGEHVTPKPKLTALGTPPAGDGDVDVLIYPDAVAYRGVNAQLWRRIRDEHLRGGRVVEDVAEPLAGVDVLVCGHGARDVRCGTCGPFVAKAIESSLAARGRTDVRVHMSSHVGGHKYAGNVIVYPGGRWYGYVRPEDADALLDAELSGTAWEPHLRGVGGAGAP